MASNGPRSIDLEKAVKLWAWREYVNSGETRRQKKLRKKEESSEYSGRYVGVVIDWSDVHMHDVEKWPRGVHEDVFDQSPKRDNNANANNIGNASQSAEKKVIPEGGVTVTDRSRVMDGGKTQVSVLFHTHFANNTGADQQYTIKTEKTTRSVIATELETCWTKSMECGLSLKTPGELLELNAGFQTETSITKLEGESHEEEMTWGVESQITVKEKHLAEAQLEVTEKKYKGEFEIVTHFEGTVYVTFTDVQHNNSLLKATGYSIAKLLKFYKDLKKVYEPYEFVNIIEEGGQAKRVEIVTKGSCKFRCGITQRVAVTQSKIKPE